MRTGRSRGRDHALADIFNSASVLFETPSTHMGHGFLSWFKVAVYKTRALEQKASVDNRARSCELAQY